MSWGMIALGEVIADCRNGFAYGGDEEDGIVQLRMNNVSTDGALYFSKVRRVPSDTRNIDAMMVKHGDVVFNATNSPELVGKSAFIPELNFPLTYSNHFTRLRPASDRLDGRYLARWLNHLWSRGEFSRMCKQWVNQATVSAERLLASPIPLPPLSEQRRIAAILDQADALRRLRRQSLARLAELEQAFFRDVFGDLVANSKEWKEGRVLGDVAQIASGITKGRKINGQATREVPYLAVSNVQDGHVRLDVVKTIEATEGEIIRYRLQSGDIVLTEGGDPDKLGRGGVWQGEIVDCIHQNHVFRVRVTDAIVRPLFLSRLIGSQRGKRYFLRSAKQTTGIASINMTQLRNFPLLLPPLSVQKKYEEEIGRLEQEKQSVEKAHASTDSLFTSLQHRAFAGEL